jgi:DNA gyrase/topoisomerase IV subunit A
LDKTSEILLLENINDNSVDFVPNYDNTTTEPSVLPSKLPLYLINGAFGIAAGYMVSVPPHNFNQTINKVIELLKNPNISINDFVKDYLPDFPSGGIICNKTALTNAYMDCELATKNKTSNIILRAKIKKDEKNNSLIVTEIPYMKALDDIIDSIKKLVTDKTITGIKNIVSRAPSAELETGVLGSVKKAFSKDTLENAKDVISSSIKSAAKKSIDNISKDGIGVTAHKLTHDPTTGASYGGMLIKSSKAKGLEQTENAYHIAKGVNSARQSGNIETANQWAQALKKRHKWGN